MKRLSIWNLITLFVLTMVVGPASAQVTAIRAGRMIDPVSGSTESNMIILVEEKIIQSVGRDIRIPDGATVIDLSGMTVLPGLIDSHTHLCDIVDAKGDVGNQLLLYTLIATTADRALHGAANARSMLEAGFTVVRDMGNAGNFADVSLRRAIEAGIVPGPTLFVSGKIIAPFGGQFVLDPEYPDIGKQDYFYADTKDEIRKAIRQNIHFGVDWIKIVVDDYPYIYSAEDIRFFVEESAAAGYRVAAHCVTERGTLNAIEAGLASIEHGFEMSDETMRMAKKKGIVLCATDLTPQIMDLYNFFTATYEDIVDRLRRAYSVGIPVVFGSDIVAPVPGHTRGSATMSLIDVWVEAGVSPLEIIRAMTVNGARLMNIEDERGSIAVGLYADIIATPENPLDNIQALKNVRFVMKEGKVYKRTQ